MPYCLKAHKNGKKVVFLLDDASFHRSKKLLERCDENAITVIVIPGGTTSILQPLDVVVNKPLKDSLGKNYTEWIINQTKNEDEATTKSGYIKAPSNEIIMNWITEIQKELKPDLMIKASSKTVIDDISKKKLFDKLKMNWDKLIEK